MEINVVTMATVISMHCVYVINIGLVNTAPHNSHVQPLDALVMVHVQLQVVYATVDG